MATFSTNQVRQLYVAKELKATGVTATDAAGSIAVKTDNDGTHLYFEHIGAGGQTRSDLIDIKNIIRVKATDADTMAHKLARFKITLDGTINTSLPVPGQDYLLRIAFRNYVGLSEEDQYFKYGMVHAVVGMTASEFYKTLALSLVGNFSREETGLLKFFLETGGTEIDEVGTLEEVTKATKAADLTDTYTGIVIEEMPQDWVLGVMSETTVNFTLQPDAIISDGDERIWGIVKQVESVESVPNGHKIADLEYFCMGERSDMYRMIGWPHVIRTKYLVDPEVKHNVIDIHYAFVGNNESVQKSEKDITIVVPKIGADNAEGNELANDIISAISAATGLSIDTLSVV